MKNMDYNDYLWTNRRNLRVLLKIMVKKFDGDVRFQTGCRNMAVVDSAMKQIPRSTERISSYVTIRFLNICINKRNERIKKIKLL